VSAIQIDGNGGKGTTWGPEAGDGCGPDPSTPPPREGICGFMEGDSRSQWDGDAVVPAVEGRGASPGIPNRAFLKAIAPAPGGGALAPSQLQS